MNVLILASWYPTVGSQSGSFFQDKARAYARCQCRVAVMNVELKARISSSEIGLQVTENQGVTECRFTGRNYTPFLERGVAWQKTGVYQRLFRTILEEWGKPDILLLESARCSEAAIAICREYRIPMGYTEHYSKILKSKPDSYLDKLMKKAVKAADFTFLISNSIREKLNPPREKSTLLPNAVDYSLFSVASPADGFVFKALGSLRKIKGYSQLIRAFADVHALYPNARLEIGGKGEEFTTLQNLILDLKLENVVTLLGEIQAENRNAFFSNGHAFVCSSETETFSIVTVEAFACGIPVVATKCGGPEDLVRPWNGYLVENHSVSSLADGMIQMIENRGSFDSNVIRERTRVLYDQQLLAEKQLDILEGIVQAYNGRHNGEEKR